MKLSLADLKMKAPPIIDIKARPRLREKKSPEALLNFTKTNASRVIDTKKAITDNIKLAETYGTNLGKSIQTNKVVVESKPSPFDKLNAVMTDFGHKIANIPFGKVTIGDKIPKIQQNPKLTGYSATASSILAIIALILMIKRLR